MPNPVSKLALGAASAADPQRIERGAPAREVAPKKTITPPSEVRAALSRALESLTGEPPSNQTLDVLTAHVSHETARGTAMLNYNFGGIKGKSPAGDTARYMTHEVLPTGERKAMSQPFRAYATLDDGAADYLSVMQNRFPEAMDQAKNGDPAAFAAALKRRGYYTASEQSYTHAMKSLTSDPSATGRVQGAAPAATERHGTGALAAARFPSRERLHEAAHLSPSAADGRISSYAGPDQLLTTIALSRVMDALSTASPRVASPDDPADAERVPG